jgi:bisphosphoglycerate-dependent phosphoglycerate mutase
MKKLKPLAMLLAIVILVTSITGCSSKKEVEFGASINNFIELITSNTSPLLNLCSIEADCMREDGVASGKQSKEYNKKCVSRYTSQLAKWELDGFDTSNDDVSDINERTKQIKDEYKRIKGLKTRNAENYTELMDAVTRAYDAHQKMVNLAANIYGPADKFYQDAQDAFNDATIARSDILELLVPYYKKPGYAELINQ